jgi:predicted metalloendopeptidase
MHSPAGSSATIVDGYTPAQRFFLGFARIWAANEPYGVDAQYAPSRLRVNLSLANLAEFARTFGCKKGERMVAPPAQRCRIW